MNIGDVSKHTGLPAKTIRYYEEIGLVMPDRRENGYRSYDSVHLQQLAFIRRARTLGFNVDSCRKLLALYTDRERASSDVKSLAKQHLGEIDLKMRELKVMAGTLRHLIANCQGDDRPDCPIINELAGKSERRSAS